MPKPVIYWFRADLRLSDLPGLVAASNAGPVIPVYILDDQLGDEWKFGGATRWWLHHSLDRLNKDLMARDGKLILRRGETTATLATLMQETGATHIYASRQYQPWAQQSENELKDLAQGRGGDFKRYPGTLIFEPEEIKTGAGTPFKVFTPFWRACLKGRDSSQPLAIPTLSFSESMPKSLELEELGLLPTRPNWAEGWETLWCPGEAGAEDALQAFLASHVSEYGEGRDFPAQPNTSRLSPHLKFGEISPRQIWAAAQHLKHAEPATAASVDKFLAEIGWREFCNHLVAQFPAMPDRAFNSKFDHFPWGDNEEYLSAWQQGMTGYPIVDAGMRELWTTGWMHNRVRMVVASFLVKHLRLPWQRGAAWFWDTLVDADLANNTLGWQWTAGCGADAAPYFRVFNPMLQGAKFDREGEYVRRWVPELAKLPNQHLHCPWEAPMDILAEAEVTLGKTYPHPLVDHGTARAEALAAYQELKREA